MSVKKDLLKEIDKKAQKIRDKRVVAANNKTLEDAVFEFFRNIESARGLNNLGYNLVLFNNAYHCLLERIQIFDKRAKISIEFNTDKTREEFDPIYDNENVRGVTIWWSKEYIIKNNVSPSYYIDVSQMLFF